MTVTVRLSPSPTVGLVVGCVLLALSSLSVADDTPRRTQIVDSSTDRTPAKTAFPSYPAIARRDRIEGDATVCFKIDQHGRIRSAKVVEVTHPIFKRSAIAAIRKSSFEPLAPNEVLATGRTCRTYRFRLEPVLAAEK
ncbi:energy transducer TonB family protein [Woeseia oceani]|uniref:Protein TonB n=1 Tax=Woeseia oceani TaxID=1548547 RepID=A0A193LD33_9GAMM|nr:energy transducer TonB [Woeseia oceani]ANO50294.1 hypothetical protein BA177_02830 [Woeseia oceani]